MPPQLYGYEALTSTGEVTRGTLRAEDESELEEQLRELGHYLIRAEVETTQPELADRITDGKVRRDELIAFTEYLAGSAQVGVPILAALDDLEARLSTKRMRRIVAEIRFAMAEEGKALSEALADHPKAFSQLFVATVEAGEATGKLDYALQQLTAYLDWQQEIQAQVRQATMYPAIVFVAMVGLIGVLVAYVFPRILPIIGSFDVELPLPTRITMTVAGFLQGYWPVLLGGIVGFIVLMVMARRTASGRYLTDRLSLRIPVLGDLLYQINMARFVTYMALFYRTGIGLIRGLQLVERILTNRMLAVAVRDARERIEGGDSISEAFRKAGAFPPIVIRSLALGESTGRLDDSLGRTKAYYDREVPTAVKRLLAALQPALVVFLGSLILVVALSIVLPIMTIYQTMGR